MIKPDKLTKNEIHRIARFLFWGGINTLISFASYCGLVWVGAHIYIASLVSLIVGICLGHYLNKNNVFKSEQQDTFFKYFVLWGVLYLIHIGILTVLVGNGYSKYISGFVAGLLLVPLSYLAQKVIIFR